MNVTSVRILGESVGVGLVCVAAYYFSAGLAQRNALLAEHDLEAVQSQLARTPIVTLGAEQETRIAARTDRGLERLNAGSLLEQDESRLYSRIMEISRAHGVRVDHLQPIVEAARAAVPPPGEAPSPVATESRRVTMTFVGRFGDLVEMMQELQSDAGFVAVESIRVTPGEGPDAGLVKANVTTRHVGLRLSESGKGGTP